ncbi:MAG TPA: CHAT domain-containing protein [Kofleriaceae bacterium]|nr:CHAT domain-containing protein [Kofleriaceae bacterium]
MDFEELKRRGLLADIEAAFNSEPQSRAALGRIGYPLTRLPAFGPGFWARICEDIAQGAVAGGLKVLLAEAARQFPTHPAFARWRWDDGIVSIARPTQGSTPTTGALPTMPQVGSAGPQSVVAKSALGLAKILAAPFLAVGGVVGWVFSGKSDRAMPAPVPNPKVPDAAPQVARGEDEQPKRPQLDTAGDGGPGGTGAGAGGGTGTGVTGGLAGIGAGGADRGPFAAGTGVSTHPTAIGANRGPVAFLEDDDATSASPTPAVEASTLYWNIGFPGNDAVFASRVMIAGTAYALETALQAAQAVHSFSRATVDAKELLVDAAEVPVKFVIEARGARVRAEGAHDWAASVASEGLTCRATGTGAFRAEVQADTGGPVSITVALQVRGAIALRESIALHAVAIPGQQPEPSAPEEPAPDGIEISAAAIHAVPEAALVLQLEPSDRWYGLKLTAGGVEDTATLHTCATTMELAKEAVLARKKLVALSKRYRAEPAAGDDPFAGLRPADHGDALLEIARIGRRLHALLFGEPEENVPLDLTRIAELIRGHGQSAQTAPRMQIDAETLPFPWGIVYDATGSLDSVADVVLRGFWGRRFAIDRTISAILRSLPPPTLEGAIQPCLNPHLDTEEHLEVVARQRGFWKRIEHRQVRPAIESGDQLRAYLKDEGSAAPAILYFFCHARAAHEMNDQLFQIAAAADEQASLLLDASGSQGELSVGELRKLRKSPLKARPLVFLNACSSAEADQYYQSQFLTLFVSQWQARAFIGSDWKIPTEFADAFARRALDRFLGRDPEAPRLALGAALHATAVEVLELKNPFPLIYALYGRPELQAA